MPVFDSRQYAWRDLELWMLGKRVSGARDVKYTVSHEKEAVYGAGNEPQGIGHGNKSYEGTITLLQSEIESLTATAIANGGNDLTDLTGMNLVVRYAPQNGAQTVDVLQYVEFTEFEKGMAQNDKYAEIDVPFVALRIKKGG